MGFTISIALMLTSILTFSAILITQISSLRPVITPQIPPLVITLSPFLIFLIISFSAFLFSAEVLSLRNIRPILKLTETEAAYKKPLKEGLLQGLYSLMAELVPYFFEARAYLPLLDWLGLVELNTYRHR